MRNDDPGNLIYAATGIEIFYPLANGEFKQLILKFGAEAYVAKDKIPDWMKKKSDLAQLIYGSIEAAKSGALDPKNLNIALFDNPHDIAVINWAYNAYADPSLSNIVTLDDFRRTLKFLSKG